MLARLRAAKLPALPVLIVAIAVLGVLAAALITATPSSRGVVNEGRMDGYVAAASANYERPGSAHRVELKNGETLERVLEDKGRAYCRHIAAGATPEDAVRRQLNIPNLRVEDYHSVLVEASLAAAILCP